MRNTVPDILFAEPSGISTAQTDVQEHVKHQPLFAADWPTPFELFDQLDLPSEMTFAVATINLDTVSRIPVVQLMLYGPFEQGARGVLEMSALVRRACRYSFLDLFPGNCPDRKVTRRILDLLEDRTTWKCVRFYRSLFGRRWQNSDYVADFELQRKLRRRLIGQSDIF